jgi:hypothetical protein
VVSVTGSLYIGGDVSLATGVLERTGAHSLRPPQKRQGRLHGNAVMAKRQYEVGHIGEACATWNTFLDDIADLSTARGDEHFAAMRTRLAPVPHGPGRAGAQRTRPGRLRR